MRTEHATTAVAHDPDDGHAHDHTHVHEHPQPHEVNHFHHHGPVEHGAVVDEGPLGTSDPGSVVLDIGGDAGALVVVTTEELHYKEIEIRVVGEPWAGAHTAIRERRQGSRVQFAGVFPRLDAGLYELRVLGRHDDGITILVAPGVVNELWMGAPRD
jgi:hypothetical protein